MSMFLTLRPNDMLNALYILIDRIHHANLLPIHMFDFDAISWHMDGSSPLESVKLISAPMKARTLISHAAPFIVWNLLTVKELIEQLKGDVGEWLLLGSSVSRGVATASLFVKRIEEWILKDYTRALDVELCVRWFSWWLWASYEYEDRVLTHATDQRCSKGRQDELWAIVQDFEDVYFGGTALKKDVAIHLYSNGTAFHPQTDGQSERTIQTLEDMLRACALEWTGSWDEYLCLVWSLIEITNEKVTVAKEKLKRLDRRQRVMTDKHSTLTLEFLVGDRVFLKVRSRGSDCDFPVVFSLSIALLRNKSVKLISAMKAYLDFSWVPRFSGFCYGHIFGEEIELALELIPGADPNQRLRIVMAHVELKGKGAVQEMLENGFIRTRYGIIMDPSKVEAITNGRDLLGDEIYSDASKKGLGCVLMQHGKVIAYASRQLKPYEVNYPTHDLGVTAVVHEDGVVWFRRIGLCSNDKALSEMEIMTEAHSSSFTIHQVQLKCTRFETVSFVERHEEDGLTFVPSVLPCQQVKIEHQRASGLLQPLEIPMWKWDEISMDFVTGLPTTQKRHDAIWVVVDRLTKDPKFTSHFWKGLQKAWGTRLKFSTAFHPQTDGQSERTIQTLEDMLRACALEWTGSWDEYFVSLVELCYNIYWHASIKAAPFELLYGRKCRAPICWDESFKLEFRVFLKVSPFRGVKRFGIKGKLSPRFIGPFEILERIGEVSYRLALPPQLSHVHDVFHISLLRGYHYHPLHVASYPFDQIQPDMSLSEEPESILDRQERVMRNKVIPFVKILWKNHPEREATWETEESMRASYPHFFV
ncbi:putative reverse transcriptase domain-containing protein [Tanacetum coccineum]